MSILFGLFLVSFGVPARVLLEYVFEHLKLQAARPQYFLNFLSTIQLAWHCLAKVCSYGQAGVGRRSSHAHEEGSLLDAATGITIHNLCWSKRRRYMTQGPRPVATVPHCEFSERSRKAVRYAMVPSHCTVVEEWPGPQGQVPCQTRLCSNNRFHSSN